MCGMIGISSNPDVAADLCAGLIQLQHRGQDAAGIPTFDGHFHLALGQEVMDEDFFAYCEDVDLAWRIRQQNLRTLYVPEAVAYHHKKGPKGKEQFIQVKAFTNRYWRYPKK